LTPRERRPVAAFGCGAPLSTAEPCAELAPGSRWFWFQETIPGERLATAADVLNRHH